MQEHGRLGRRHVAPCGWVGTCGRAWVGVGDNERGVPNFRYELADFFWRFPNEFAMIRTKYRLKIVKVGN